MDNLFLQAAPLVNEKKEEMFSLKLIVDYESKGTGEMRIVNSMGEIRQLKILDEKFSHLYEWFLQDIEKWAVSKKLTTIHMNVMNNNLEHLNHTSDSEKSLVKLKWVQHNSQNVFIYNAIKLNQSRWMRTNYLNQDYTIESIMTMTNEEKEEVEGGRNNWYPERFYPFQYNEMGKNSLVMRNKGKLIGWCITTIVSNNLLLYDNLYVKKEFWNLGRSISLFMKALQIQCSQSPFRYFTCTINGENQPLLKIIQNKTKDYVIDYKELKMYQKALDLNR